MSEEIERDDFPFAKSFKRKRKKTKKTPNALSFKLAVETEAKCEELKSHAVATKHEHIIDNECDALECNDNVEDFFIDAHEDESDPNYAKLSSTNEARRRESDRQKQMAQDQLDRTLINTKLDAKWRSQLTNFQKRVEELEKKMTTSQATQREELNEHMKKHVYALKRRGSEELKKLAGKNQSETERINAKYKQYCDQSGNLTSQIMQMMNMSVKIINTKSMR